MLEFLRCPFLIVLYKDRMFLEYHISIKIKYESTMHFSVNTFGCWHNGAVREGNKKVLRWAPSTWPHGNGTSARDNFYCGLSFSCSHWISKHFESSKSEPPLEQRKLFFNCLFLLHDTICYAGTDPFELQWGAITRDDSSHRPHPPAARKTLGFLFFFLELVCCFGNGPLCRMHKSSCAAGLRAFTAWSTLIATHMIELNKIQI